MQIFDTRIAGLTIRMHTQLQSSRNLCEDYVICTETKPDLHVQLPEGFEGGAMEEWLALHEDLARQLPRFNRLLMHGASIEYGGNGYLFTAPSGTGKSTHIRLWRRMLGQSVGIVNGDKPILHVADGGVWVCGTPWAGKEGWQRNVCVPLKGICLLRRGSNAIRKIDFSACAAEILNQVYIPGDEESLLQTMDLLDQVLTRVPLYELSCDMTEEAVKTSFEYLTGESYRRQEGDR